MVGANDTGSSQAVPDIAYQRGMCWSKRLFVFFNGAPGAYC